MMKRIVAMLITLAFAGGMAFADDGDLESRLKSVEESLDQMKRDKAEQQAPNLAQGLDWGNGWAFGLNMGTELSGPATGVDVLSPVFLNNFRVVLTNSVWFDFDYPEPLTNPDTEYETIGMLSGLRVVYTSPLFFNFTRLYGGLGYDYALLIGMNDADAMTSGNVPILQKTTTEVFGGIDFFVSRKMSAYLEFAPQWTPLAFGGITVFEWVSDSDKAYFRAVNAIPGQGEGVTLKAGLRFYF